VSAVPLALYTGVLPLDDCPHVRCPEMLARRPRKEHYRDAAILAARGLPPPDRAGLTRRPLRRGLVTGPRPLAIAVAYVLGVVVVLGLGTVVVGTAATQITALAGRLPRYAHQAQAFEPQALALLQPLGITAAALHTTQQHVVAVVQGVGTTVAKESLALVSRFVSTLIDLVLILILSVYLTANGPTIARRYAARPPARTLSRYLLYVVTKVNNYVEVMWPP